MDLAGIVKEQTAVVVQPDRVRPMGSQPAKTMGREGVQRDSVVAVEESREPTTVRGPRPSIEDLAIRRESGEPLGRLRGPGFGVIDQKCIEAEDRVGQSLAVGRPDGPGDVLAGETGDLASIIAADVDAPNLPIAAT